jgi:hypothetical protein
MAMKISEALRLSGTVSDALCNDIVALEVDAQRFNGIRMIVCEPDKAKREKMLDAFEQRVAQFAERFGDVELVTPADVDEFVDLLLLAACEARK